MENEGETESNSFWLGIKKSRYSRLNRSSPLLFSFSPFFLHVRISVFYYYYFRFVEIMRTSLIKFYFVFQEKIRYGETKSMKQTFRIRLIIEEGKCTNSGLRSRNLEIKIMIITPPPI